MRRSRLSARGLPIDELRALLADRRTHFEEAVVVKAAGSHWAVQDGLLVVHVELGPKGKPASCKIPGVDEDGHGISYIPRPGSLVAVAVPGGRMAAGPWIIAQLGRKAAQLNGENLVIGAVGDVVLQGGTQAVARQGDGIAVNMTAFDLAVNEVIATRTPGTPGISVTPVDGAITGGNPKVKA